MFQAGTLDKRGHDIGWTLAKIIEHEVKDLAARVGGLIAAGWKEVLVVTDHGWLLMPGGLEKRDLPKFLVESRWGRCAAVKETANTDFPIVGWHWNPLVSVASPPGIGCFKAGKEYDHGGISLQELVVPRILVRPATGVAEAAKIASVKWVGLRCRVTIEGVVPGLKVDLRGRVAEAKSKVEGGKPKELSEDGTVSLAVESPDDEGTAAHVVLVAADGTVLASVLTTIGEVT